ncbi:MAG: GNA1162 family protein, partial [Opitutaceae bacterium]
TVSAEAKLVDVKTGVTLWSGTVTVQQSSSDSGGGILGALVTAAVTQIVNSNADPAHNVSSMANCQLFELKDHGLLHGPYFPKDKEE